MMKKKPVEKSQEQIFETFFSASSDEEDQVIKLLICTNLLLK